MFGWEFPPHITGGLGTACFGLVKGLCKHGVDVIFVVPKAYGDESKEGFRLVNASDMVLDFTQTVYQDHWNRIKVMEIGSNLIPYVGPEEFEQMVREDAAKHSSKKQSVFSERYQFSGKYGHKLMEEVSRYAIVASVIAQQTKYDVIHAHDWLTYAAGIAAKSPAAVVIRASETPGATARKVAAPAVPRPWKASMMPQTVPKRPMNGVTAPVVASQGSRFSRRVSSSDEAI